MLDDRMGGDDGGSGEVARNLLLETDAYLLSRCFLKRMNSSWRVSVRGRALSRRRFWARTDALFVGESSGGLERSAGSVRWVSDPASGSIMVGIAGTAEAWFCGGLRRR